MSAGEMRRDAGVPDAPSVAEDRLSAGIEAEIVPIDRLEELIAGGREESEGRLPERWTRTPAASSVRALFSAEEGASIAPNAAMAMASSATVAKRTDRSF